MKTPKYSVLIIKFEELTVDNNTGEICSPTFEQKMLDHYKVDRQYSRIELQSKIGSVSANTLRNLDEKIWQFAEDNKLGYSFKTHKLTP